MISSMLKNQLLIDLLRKMYSSYSQCSMSFRPKISAIFAAAKCFVILETDHNSFFNITLLANHFSYIHQFPSALFPNHILPKLTPDYKRCLDKPRGFLTQSSLRTRKETRPRDRVGEAEISQTLLCKCIVCVPSSSIHV